MPNMRGAEWVILIVMAVVIAAGVVVILRGGRRRAAAIRSSRLASDAPQKAPTGKLWWGGILLVYALVMLFMTTQFGGIQIVALVAGIVLLGLGFQDRRQWQQQRQVTAIAAGWHDDPESPERLRYHDGKAWTDRTAAKSSAGQS